MQSPGGEAAKLGADVLGGGSGGTGGSGRVLGHSAKEAGSLEAVAEGSPSSVDVKTPPKQRGADNVAAPSPSPAAPKEKVGGGSTTEHRETVQGSVGGGSHAPDAGQLAESRADFQSSGSGEKAASTGERASLSSGPSPGMGAPGHTPAAASAERRSQDAQTPPAVRSSQAGKDQQDTGQKVSHSTREVSVGVHTLVRVWLSWAQFPFVTGLCCR